MSEDYQDGYYFPKASDIGYKHGMDVGYNLREQEQKQVSQEMKTLGFCKWADAYKKANNCND